MTLRLNGATSGYTEIDAPAVAGNNNLKLPGGNGSDGNILGTDGAGNLSWVNGRMVLGTSQASTSGTSVDFTGIPSWVKRVTVMFNGVSTNGTGNIQVQIGSGGFTTSGYRSGTTRFSGAATAQSTATTGFLITNAFTAATAVIGHAILTVPSGNVWICSSSIHADGYTGNMVQAGDLTLSGTLTQLRIIGSSTGNPADTFDAGSINILYEG